MKKVVIVGGGLAGISSAVYLREKNFDITLIESAPQLGGRAKSFFDNQFNLYLDNGQHLLIKGYESTLDLITKFKVEENFIFQKEFEILFRDKNKREWSLKIDTIVNSLISFLGFKNLNLSEKISLINFFSKIDKLDDELTEELTTLEFLQKLNQSENLINNFWKLVIESALNTPIQKTSANVFLFILKKMFVENKSNPRFIIPKKSLLESLIIPAENYLINNGVRVIKNSRIHNIVLKNDLAVEVSDREGRTYRGDYFILAVHPSIVQKLFPDINLRLDYQSIINLHLKISNKEFSNHFYALWDSIIHWVFFHENHLTIVKSSADEFLNFSNQQILELFIDELIKFFPELKEELSNIKFSKKNFKVIKEKRATFLSDINSTKSRPSWKTNIPNLFLAGDYVNTGYPSTIESAVLSGKMIADELN